MALFNSFTFGDVDSEDYGVYISGDSVYDSPARSVDLVQVPGRNGALALDNGYYENIEVTYPAGSFGTSQTEWREKMLGIRNALAAQRGYQKLIDTYHPEHYRLGMFFAGISATPVQYNRAGQFPIRFNCKPQRFLISGDTPVEFTAEGQEEVYGPSSIASFEAEEGAEIRQLEVDLEPVQDLNGYDNPWPAGGGKNLLDFPDRTLEYQGLTYTFNEAAGTITLSGVRSTSADGFTAIQSWWTLKAGTYTLSGDLGRTDVLFGVRNSSGSIREGNGSFTLSADTQVRCYIQFHTALDASTPIVFKPQLEKGSTATSWSPYSNICPISGHTEVNVYRTGKNLYNEIAYPFLGSSYINAQNGVFVGGNASYQAVRAFIPCKQLQGQTITLNHRPGGASPGFAFYSSDSESTFISGVRNSSQTAGNPMTVAIPSNAEYMRFTVPINTADAQLELGSTATDYEPYAGQTYPIPLGQTVYGGTLDVTTGVLTINRELVTYDGSEAWSQNGDQGVFISSPAKYRVAGYNYSTNKYKVINYGTADRLTDGQSCWNSAVNAVQIKDSRAMTTSAFKTLLASEPLQICYYLVTPQTYQLTPTQVSTLLGANNIWSDSGEVEVKVASPVDLTNPTNFPAKPLIRVYGNGSVQVGDTIATVQNNADGYVDIDCESMNCYDTTGGRNADVSFSGNDFPELASGDNGILLTGPSRVEITPRWWEL